MSAFLIGNLLGRFLFSAFLVWVVLLLINKINFKLAWQKLRRPLPLLAVLLVFFLGLIGSAKASENDGKQLFHVMSFPEAHLDDVYLPAEPQWDYELDKRHSTHALIMSSPANAVNPAVLELVLDNRLRVPADQLQVVSTSTINVLKRKLGLSDNVKAEQLAPVKYGELSGWSHGFDYSHGGTDLQFDIEVMVLPSGHVISAMSSARKDELHIFSTTKGKILSHLKEHH